MNWAIAAGTIGALIAFVFAPQINTYLLVPGFDADAQAQTTELMRIMLPTVVIFGASGLLMGILNAHQHFLLPALAPSAYNLGIIGGAVFLSPSMGVHGLAWGTVLGAGLHLLVQVPALRGLGARWEIAARAEGAREVLTLMLPRVIGVAVVQVNFWVNNAFTSGMAAGAPTALMNSFQIMLMPQAILAQSVATAVFPSLSALFASDEVERFKSTLGGAMRSILFLALPASAGLIVLAVPVVRALYEHGDWTYADSVGTAWVLIFWAAGLAGHSLLEVLARAFYAMHDTITPVAVGGSAMALNVLLSLMLSQMFAALFSSVDDFSRNPAGGLALANSLATGLESLALWLLLRRKIGSVEDRRTVISAAKSLIASGIMAAVIYGVDRALAGASPFVMAGVAIPVGAAVFFGSAYALGSEEARSMLGAVRARMARLLARVTQ
jgi:putative peptidoglycan lipid II flippase